MNLTVRYIAKCAIPILGLSGLVAGSSTALALTLTWTHLGSGNFNDPGNWFGGSGTHVPDANDFVSFEIAAAFGAPYTVTFPGNDIGIGGGGAGAADASYATAFLRVRDHGVTFDGSTQFGKGPSTYSVVSPTQTEANRGIIIGETPGENALLSVSHSGFVCCGGLSTFSGVAATLGDAAGAAGTLNMNVGAFNVTGSDFTQTQLIIGNNGTGTLNVNNGADVNVTGFNSKVSLGHHATGIGTVSINGTGSTWTNHDQLWVGESGTGALTVQNGATLTTSSGAGGSNIIGVFGGSNGMVTITDPGSTWNNTNGLTVGNSGNGTLLITNGGSLTSTGTALGGGFAASGTATVTGAGSTWTDLSTIIGTTGAGALAIQNGGNMTSGSALIRGLNSGSGQVLVAGAGSTWTVTTGPLTIGLPEGGFTTGPTSLTINPGGTVNVAHDIDLDTNSTLKLQGGTLSAAEIGLNGLQFNGQFQWTSGTLHVGVFRKSLTNQGGTLAPGHSAGSTIIDGNYTQQAAGTMELEIGGTASGTQFDNVGLEGTANLDGLLRLTLINGFVPTAVQTFDVLDSFGITGAFSNAANGQRLTTADGLGSFVVNYLPADAESRNHIVLTNFVSVPLPGDYNHNGIVDAADYTVWRDTLGQTGAGLAADGNGNNQIDAGDYNIWKVHFGSHAGSGSGGTAAVPEPSAIALAMMAATLLCARPRAANKCSC
jgi:T5SS/PEP-CTERM-associated repeat protein